MNDPDTQLENLLERIDTSDDIAAADRKQILAFNDRLSLLAQEYSTYRQLKLLRHITLLAERCEDGLVTAALDDRDAAESLVSHINRRFDNEETNRDYRSALRVFGRRVTDGDDVPESLEWVPTGTSSDHDPTPDPRDMLRWKEHVKPMIATQTYSRNRAMIALQFDAGLRGGEFKSLSVGDIQDHKHGLEVTFDGKQGRRSVLCVPAVPHVNSWLDDHPAREELDAPLWTKLSNPEGISDRMIYDVFQNAAEEAGITRPITLTNFRKSSAAHLASRNTNQAVIEDHHGWVRGSDAAARYIAVFGGDRDREIARAHGVDIPEEDEPEDMSPIECHTCERLNDRDASFCDQCGQALDAGTAAKVSSEETNAGLALAELPPEKAKQLFDATELLDDPDIKRVLFD